MFPVREKRFSSFMGILWLPMGYGKLNTRKLNTRKLNRENSTHSEKQKTQHKKTQHRKLNTKSQHI